MISLLQWIPVLIILVIIRQTRRRHSNLHNVPSPRSPSWLQGHLPQLFNPNAWGFHEKLMVQYGSVVGVRGGMGDQQLYTFDPKIMYQVLVKDQGNFENSSLSANQLIFGDGLLSVTGDHHRQQKKLLNPVFSIAHMREMLPVFYEVVNKLQDALLERVQAGPQEVEMVTWMTRTALELIGQSGLGYSFDPLTDDATEHMYSQMIKNLVPAFFKLSPVPRTYLTPVAAKLSRTSPRLGRLLLNILVPFLKPLRVLRDMADYAWELSEEIYEERKRALLEGEETIGKKTGRGKDILSILIKANIRSEDPLDEKEVIAQMSTFTFAATDTTSNALSRVLYLLATHPDVQSKLRQELAIAHRENNKGIPYDTLVDHLPYLDAICRETLRLFPPVTILTRFATRDTSLSISHPIIGVDGSKLISLNVPKNTFIHLSLLNSNRNPELWGPDAMEWKPERWLKPLPKEVVDARIPGVYSHLMTFNAGTRSCIGFKFSQLEMKAALSMLVYTFKFSPGKHNISWHMDGITSPFVEGDNEHPRMPLVVGVAGPSD